MDGSKASAGGRRSLSVSQCRKKREHPLHRFGKDAEFSEPNRFECLGVQPGFCLARSLCAVKTEDWCGPAK